MEILGNTHHYRFVFGNSLDFVAPFSRNLHRRLYRFRSSIHRQYHVKAKKLCDELGKAGEYIVIECSRAESDPRCLFRQSFDQFRMAMALIYSAICRQKVQIMFSLAPYSSYVNRNRDSRSLSKNTSGSQTEVPEATAKTIGSG